MHFNRYARKARRCRALIPAWLAFGLLLATAGPAVSASASVTHAQSQSQSQSSSQSQRVAYRGYTFTVPRTWRVIDLAAHPHSCVRFDRHVLYLGTPGRDQDCPSTLIGTTEALLVQPAAARATAAATMYPVDRLITVTTARIVVTATYSTDRALIDRILAGASLRVPVRGTRRTMAAPDVPGGATARMASAPATVPASATDFTGKGFDACAAPSSATMTTWLRLSPYRAVGIYIGGSDRACAQPALTASWVSQQQAAGWHFMPIYVGPQAGFGEIKSRGQPGGQRGPGRGESGPAAGLRPGDAPVLRHGSLSQQAERPGAALPDLVDQRSARPRIFIWRVQQLAFRCPGPGQQLHQRGRHYA